jgi:hypothetical protein
MDEYCKYHVVFFRNVGAGRLLALGRQLGEVFPPLTSIWPVFMGSANAIYRARGFFLNTIGRDEEAIRAYIRHQAKEDQRLEQLNLWR